jgi:hypothetical protein
MCSESWTMFSGPRPTLVLAKRSDGEPLSFLQISILLMVRFSRREPVTTSTPRLMSMIRKGNRNAVPSVPLDIPDPLSLPALLERLATFKLSTYSADKPRCIDPVAAARLGWINAHDDVRERLSCVTCKRSWRMDPPRAPGGWRSDAGN